MAFIESPRFPECISVGANGGPGFSTTKTYTRSGRRYANQNWEFPLQRYNIATPVRTNEDFEELRSFFYNVGGAFDGFRFKDPTDYTDEDSLGNPQGIMTLVTGSTYQMVKRYVWGSNVANRQIKKPVAGSVSVFRTRSGSTTDITGSSTIDTTNGQVTVTGHISGDTYAWTGEFDVPVALVDDQAAWNYMGTSAMLTDWPAIALEGLRL
jgi:uncharacterized protein (TIGR02217 family)